MTLLRVAGALALVAIAALASLATGPLGVAPDALIAALVGAGPPEAELALALRGPRVTVALTAGGALAGAGAALQILFRNPLVAPDLLGVSSGAGLGAAAALLAGAAPALVQAGAFAGGCAAAALALACAGLARGSDPRLTLVLCGIVTGALAAAGLALMLLIADPYTDLPAITFWLLGSFSRADGGEALLAAGIAAAGLALLLLLGFRIDALGLGDDQARSLGLDARGLRLAAVAGATLATSAAVAVSGVVGWIGLLAPHAARQIAGERAGALLPASIALGAVFALAIDRLATAFGPGEIPVGLLAAAIGAPAFLLLFVVTARRSG
ncbi:FecCD family ABC transporter permease [Qipengyuania sediminis]|uniref:FecCD family ABC transporter permease n=1 Tax=Qipengyuania sediminis TaxID=1532023 RepID=UPI0010595D47|nr:iron ABC transporter permease [Qipengyuania sediminis]